MSKDIEINNILKEIELINLRHYELTLATNNGYLRKYFISMKIFQLIENMQKILLTFTRWTVQ